MQIIYIIYISISKSFILFILIVSQFNCIHLIINEAIVGFENFRQGS
jgi:hypothetical protein